MRVYQPQNSVPVGLAGYVGCMKTGGAQSYPTSYLHWQLCEQLTMACTQTATQPALLCKPSYTMSEAPDKGPFTCSHHDEPPDAMVRAAAHAAGQQIIFCAHLGIRLRPVWCSGGAHRAPATGAAALLQQ
jgi:hypothetical protein